MRTIISKFVLTIVLLTSTISNANDLAIFTKINNNLVITFTNAQIGDEWAIKNNDGKIIKSGFLKKNKSYNLSFDLTLFKNTLYNLELEKENIIKSLNFKVSPLGFSTESYRTKTIFKPRISVKNGIVNISRYTLQNSSSIIIIYENKTILKLPVKKIAKKSIKLDKNANGYYKVIVQVDGKKYRKSFSF